MSLVFHPAIGSQTIVHVPELGDAHHRFTASFASRDALECARSDGIRIEMWTNLPVGGVVSSDWHALAFEYPGEDVEKSTSTHASISLGTSDPERAGGKDVYLDLVIPNTLCGAFFSFTYRLVRHGGDVEWLGTYGQNGDIVLERLEERFTLVEGCSFKDGLVVREGETTDKAAVLRLSPSVQWVSWTFDHEG